MKNKFNPSEAIFRIYKNAPLENVIAARDFYQRNIDCQITLPKFTEPLEKLIKETITPVLKCEFCKIGIYVNTSFLTDEKKLCCEDCFRKYLINK